MKLSLDADPRLNLDQLPAWVRRGWIWRYQLYSIAIDIGDVIEAVFDCMFLVVANVAWIGLQLFRIPLIAIHCSWMVLRGRKVVTFPEK